MNNVSRLLALFVLSSLVALSASSQSRLYADVNGDGEVTISDVNAVIDVILGGTVPSEIHEFIDLGLPSGTLWATCNVGANSPEEYGDYFAWGETSPKYYYALSSYKWYKTDDNDSGFTKYCTGYYSSEGYNDFTDGKMELDPADDAATVNWGSEARMPSMEQIQELVNNCTWQWIQRNGVIGQLGTGSNGKTIFFPAAGYRSKETLKYVDSVGNYWSRTLCSTDSRGAGSLDFYSERVRWHYDSNRYEGFPVRAVRVSR